MVSSALLSSLLLLSLSGILAQNGGQQPFNLMVVDNQPNSKPITYSAHAPPGGVLIGAMTKLAKETVSGFNFTSSENIDYGAYLESVNGLFGNAQNRTYWELLVKRANTIIRPDVGISCYIPQANEMVILNYTTW